MFKTKMPLWKSHKIVAAAKIEHVIWGGGTGNLLLAGDIYVRVDAPWMNRFNPRVGDYLVEYQDDYLSVSPAKAFEDGYVPLPTNGVVDTLVFEPGKVPRVESEEWDEARKPKMAYAMKRDAEDKAASAASGAGVNNAHISEAVGKVNAAVVRIRRDRALTLAIETYVHSRGVMSHDKIIGIAKAYEGYLDGDHEAKAAPINSVGDISPEYNSAPNGGFCADYKHKS